MKIRFDDIPENIIYSSNIIGNYYGIPFVFEMDEKHYFALADENIVNAIYITTEFYNAFVEEFT